MCDYRRVVCQSSAFAYDVNGNVTAVLQNESPTISSIVYNYRDLPTKIEFNLPQDLLLNISAPITGVRVFRALNTITTQNDFTIASGGDVTMQAGSKITHAPGFHAETGSQFNAQIDPNVANQPGNAISYTYNLAGNR